MGGQKSRRYCINAYPGPGKVSSQPFCEISHRLLCRSIGRDLSQRKKCIHGSNIDNAACLPAQHVPGKFLRCQKRTCEIQIEYKLPALFINIEKGFFTAKLRRIKKLSGRCGPRIISSRPVYQNPARSIGPGYKLMRLF